MSKPRKLFKSTTEKLKNLLPRKEEVGLPEHTGFKAKTKANFNAETKEFGERIEDTETSYSSKTVVKKGVLKDQEQEALSKERDALRQNLDPLEVVLEQKDASSPRFSFYEQLAAYIRQNHPINQNLSIAEQLEQQKEQFNIFKFVDNTFIKKLSDNMIASIPEEAKRNNKDVKGYLESQFKTKISNYSGTKKLKEGLSQEFITDFRPQIPAEIEKLGYMPLYKCFGNALGMELYQRIETAYHLENEDGKELDLIDREIKKFFEEKTRNGIPRAEELVKKNIENIAKGAIATALEEFEGGKYASEENKNKILKYILERKEFQFQNLDPASYSARPINLVNDLETSMLNAANRYLMAQKSESPTTPSSSESSSANISQTQIPMGRPRR